MKLHSPKHYYLLTAFISILSFQLFSQDIILKRNGESLEVRVTEVADDYLKYKRKGMENGPDFRINTSNIFMLTFENGEKMMFEEKKKDPKEDFIILRGGTKVRLRMTETISSDKKDGRQVATGEVISLTVQQDVTDIDGNILVSAGTLVNGTITQSVKRKAAGTKGKLAFNVEIIKAVDGQSVPVNFKYEFAGKSRTGAAVAAAAVVAAPLVFIKGKPAVVQAGTVFEALTLSDKKIYLNK